MKNNKPLVIYLRETSYLDQYIGDLLTEYADIVICGNVADAATTLARHDDRIVIIVVSKNVNDGNGSPLEFLNEVRETRPDVYVICFTSDPALEHNPDWTRAAHDFIIKGEDFADRRLMVHIIGHTKAVLTEGVSDEEASVA